MFFSRFFPLFDTRPSDKPKHYLTTTFRITQRLYFRTFQPQIRRRAVETGELHERTLPPQLSRAVEDAPERDGTIPSGRVHPVNHREYSKRRRRRVISRVVLGAYSRSQQAHTELEEAMGPSRAITSLPRTVFSHYQ